MNYQRLFHDYGIDYTSDGKWVNIKCPYKENHGSSVNEPKLGFNIRKDYCNCWVCGKHNLNETLSKVLRVPRSVLLGTLSKYKAVNYERSKSGDFGKKKAISLPNDGFLDCEKKYIRKRGYSVKRLREKYGVVGGGLTGKWHHRIIIPIKENGVLVSWQARSILNKHALDENNIPRYKNLSIEDSVVNPKHCFFNIDNCNRSTVVLVEGPFDVMRFGNNFLCAMGTSLSSVQLSKLKKRFKKVVVMFDNDDTGRRKAEKYAYQIASVGLEVCIADGYSDYGVNDGGDLTYAQAKALKKELLRL